MSRINWEKLAKNIPHRVKVAPKKFYEVLLTKDFNGRDLLGETRFDPNQIVLKSDMTPKNMVHVYYHEVLHAISAEYEIGLTETQVLQLEKSFPYLYQLFRQLESKNE